MHTSNNSCRGPSEDPGKTTPSAVFRGWATRELFDGAFKQLCDLRSIDNNRAWAIRLGKNLGKEWRKELRYDLDIPRLKAREFASKGLCVVTPLWPDKCKAVAKHVDVPLDQFSLRPLACMEDLNHFKLRQASMRSVKTLKDYEDIHAEY